MLVHNYDATMLYFPIHMILQSDQLYCGLCYVTDYQLISKL